MPPDLLEFQRGFAAELEQPTAGAMSVYRNTVIRGAVEALRANFRVVELIVGPEMFEAIAVDFTSEYPPRRPVLALYGEQFADWLERQSWIGDLPYLPDVARVERLHIECLMAADAVPLPASDSSPHDLSGVVPKLHPALRFTWLSTPAMSIWLAHQRPFASDLTPEWKAEGALFTRPSTNILHSPRIGRAAYRMLFGIRAGETVGAAIATASRLYPAEDCEALFASLSNLGAFIPGSERTSS